MERRRRARGGCGSLWCRSRNAALLGAVELIVVLEGPLTPEWVSLMIPLTAVTHLGAGVVAWLRRRSSDIGALLTPVA